MVGDGSHVLLAAVLITSWDTANFISSANGGYCHAQIWQPVMEHLALFGACVSLAESEIKQFT